MTAASEEPRAKRRGSQVVRVVVVAVIVVALFFFARSIQWAEVWRAMQDTNVGILVAAAIVNLVSVAIKGVRWWIFMRPIGIPSLALAIKGTFVGAGLNNILIANGGEAARVVYVAQQSGRPAAGILATLTLERLFELIGWAFTVTLAVTVLDLPESLDAARPLAIAMLVGMSAFLIYLLRAPGNAQRPEIIGDGWLQRVRRFGRGFMLSLKTAASGPRFLGALAVSVVVWILQIATYHLTAVAAGLPISIVGTLAAMLAVNIGFGLRATPGNVGVFQMIYAVTAASFGVNKDLATGTAFLIQIQQILPVTAVALALAPRLLSGRSAEARAGVPGS